MPCLFLRASLNVYTSCTVGCWVSCVDHQVCHSFNILTKHLADQIRVDPQSLPNGAVGGSTTRAAAIYAVVPGRKHTSRDGTVRAVWRNSRTGEFRIKQMVVTKSGKRVAKYVKIPR